MNKLANIIKGAIIVLACLMVVTSCGEQRPSRFVETVERPVHDEAFYEGLLEAFCQKEFNNVFKGTEYEENSLRVVTVSTRDTDMDIIDGTLKFKYWKDIVPDWLDSVVGNKEDDGRFKAYVTANGDDEYIVIFERYGGVKEKNLKSSGEILFKYMPEE